jgi:thymidine kinase
MGSIHLVTGPMFSGKTQKLVNAVRVAAEVGRKHCLVIAPVVDDRWKGEGLGTHYDKGDGSAQASEYVTYCHAANIRDVEVDGKIQQVMIDEGQFFPDLADECEKLAARGVVVLVAALNGNYKQKAFVSVSELIPHCNTVELLHSVCIKCRALPGIFTVRIRGLPPADDPMCPDIGGADKYQAVCRGCV